jgi:hypothetical protein
MFNAIRLSWITFWDNMLWDRYGQFILTINVSGLHPYLTEDGHPKRDYPDWQYSITLNAYGYDDAIRKAMHWKNLQRGKPGWIWELIDIRKQ